MGLKNLEDVGMAKKLKEKQDEILNKAPLRENNQNAKHDSTEKDKKKIVINVEVTKKKRTTIRLPYELYKKLKFHCVNLDSSVNDYIIYLVEKDMKKVKV